MRMQYVVHRAKNCREERFLTAPTLKMSNFYILPFVLNLAQIEKKLAKLNPDKCEIVDLNQSNHQYKSKNNFLYNSVTAA